MISFLMLLKCFVFYCVLIFIHFPGLPAFTGFNAEKIDSKKCKKKKKKSPNKVEENSDDKADNKPQPKKKSTKTNKIVEEVHEEIIPTKVLNNTGSDSDSDYDFFAVAKCPKNKVTEKPVVDSSDEELDDEEEEGEEEEEEEVEDVADIAMETNFVTESGEHSNPFQNAVQSAIAQDEMIIPASVTQIYIVAPMKLRLVTLSALIIERCVKPGKGKMLVFMATQDLIDYHCEILSRVLAGKIPKKPVVVENKSKIRNAEKKAKRYNRHKEGDDFENTGEEETVEKEADVEVEIKEEDKPNKKVKKMSSVTLEGDKMGGNDDEEYFQYEYDGMDLDEYEAKIRKDKALVDVEFFQLHGSMDQRTRTEVFKTFRKATSGVLLCTVSTSYFIYLTIVITFAFCHLPVAGVGKVSTLSEDALFCF